jgi:hypothetical protein
MTADMLRNEEQCFQIPTLLRGSMSVRYAKYSAQKTGALRIWSEISLQSRMPELKMAVVATLAKLSDSLG